MAGSLFNRMMAAEARRQQEERPAPIVPVRRVPEPKVKVSAPVEGDRKRGRPKSDHTKVQITLRLDPEILDHYRAKGPGWQARLNEDLRKLNGL